LKLGRGFTLDELKAAGINSKFAQTVGIAVDHRRRNHCEESLTLNVERLQGYKAKLVVFPRRAGIIKKGDSSAAETAEAPKIDVNINALPPKAEAVTFATITEEMKAATGYSALRLARSDSRLVGRRLKAKKAKEEEEAK
jgi:large subunit ribosomal protein L13e